LPPAPPFTRGFCIGHDKSKILRKRRHRRKGGRFKEIHGGQGGFKKGVLEVKRLKENG